MAKPDKAAPSESSHQQQQRKHQEREDRDPHSEETRSEEDPSNDEKDNASPSPSPSPSDTTPPASASKHALPPTTASKTPTSSTGDPPLPDEQPPTTESDDGWAPIWNPTAQAYYFYNRFTQNSQWENPRVPEASSSSSSAGPTVSAVVAGLGSHHRIAMQASDVKTAVALAGGVMEGAGGEDATKETTPTPEPRRIAGGYNPAIHGDYDPDADYAQPTYPDLDPEDAHAAHAGVVVGGGDSSETSYSATGAFNRFTGKWQVASLTPENFNDESKSRRQMNAIFDVDAAANSHEGRSLKAERSGKKLSKKEVKAFREKRREKKEEKRRAWLRD